MLLIFIERLLTR